MCLKTCCSGESHAQRQVALFTTPETLKLNRSIWERSTEAEDVALTNKGLSFFCCRRAHCLRSGWFSAAVITADIPAVLVAATDAVALLLLLPPLVVSCISGDRIAPLASSAMLACFGCRRSSADRDACKWLAGSLFRGAYCLLVWFCRSLQEGLQYTLVQWPLPLCLREVAARSTC